MRRLAARDAHVEFITREAEAGRLLLGLPLHDEAGRSLGSLMVVAGDIQAYRAAEPFAQRGVWQRIEAHPFRIAPLPYAPWPEPGSAAQGRRSHTILIARDGEDEGAPARRMAARGAHFDRVRALAADGTLLFGGAGVLARRSLFDRRCVAPDGAARHAAAPAALQALAAGMTRLRMSVPPMGQRGFRLRGFRFGVAALVAAASHAA